MIHKTDTMHTQECNGTQFVSVGLLLVILVVTVLSLKTTLSNRSLASASAMPQSQAQPSQMWNEEIARQTPFTFQRLKDDEPEDALLTCTHTSDTTILKLYNPQTNEVLDIINVDDIIGVELEISLDNDDRDRNEKAQKGREKMDQLEQDIGAKLLQGNSGQALQGEVMESGSGSGMSSSAYLNMYVYPRKPKKENIFQRCKRKKGKSRSHNQQGDEGQSDAKIMSTTDVTKSGHRHAQHRKYKLQPTEDFANISAIIQNIRQVSNLLPLQKSSDEKYLVMVNPYSGTKKGNHIYETIVKPMLQEAGIDHDVFITKRAGHAIERMLEHYAEQEHEDKDDDYDHDGDENYTLVAKTKDVSEYSAIIAMGGDGILSEILQGLKKRHDYDNIMNRINFGIVGCGTSNGLAASILYAGKEKYSPLESTFIICKGRWSKLDLSQHQTVSRTYTSFLTFSWAFIADIDIESECIRFMGILRNDIWGAWRLLNLRTYRAKFSYLPVDATDTMSASTSETESTSAVSSSSLAASSRSEKIEKKFPNYDEDVPSNWISIDGDFILLWVSHVTHAASNLMNSPESKLSDGIFKVFIVRQPCSKWELMKILLGMETGSHVSSPKAEFIDCFAYRLDPEQISGSWGSFNNVDGEVVEPGRIQAYVQPNAIRFFTR